MNLEKRTERNKVWWIAGAILLPLLLFLALGAQDQVVSYSVFKVPAVSAYYFIYYAEKWFGAGTRLICKITTPIARITYKAAINGTSFSET